MITIAGKFKILKTRSQFRFRVRNSGLARSAFNFFVDFLVHIEALRAGQYICCRQEEAHMHTSHTKEDSTQNPKVVAVSAGADLEALVAGTVPGFRSGRSAP